MKGRLIFLFLLGALVLLGAYVFFDSEVGWTTISESNGYSLQAKDNRYRIHYYENSSARKDWYLNNYQPALNLKMRTLNSEQLKNTEGGLQSRNFLGQAMRILRWFMRLIIILRLSEPILRSVL